MVFGKEVAGQLGIAENNIDDSIKIPQPLTYFKVNFL